MSNPKTTLPEVKADQIWEHRKSGVLYRILNPQGPEVQFQGDWETGIIYATLGAEGDEQYTRSRPEFLAKFDRREDEEPAKPENDDVQFVCTDMDMFKGAGTYF